MTINTNKRKPKIYNEKCEVQQLILLTKTQKEKIKSLSVKLDKTEAQIIRTLIEYHYDDVFKSNKV